MTHSVFARQIREKLAEFYPQSALFAYAFSDCFRQRRQLIGDFLREIETTITQLEQCAQLQHAEFYAEKLLRQYQALQTARLERPPKTQSTKFESSYQFAKNIHFLPASKRLKEYRKVLLALNEKISWLIAQSYAAETESARQQFATQLAETEQRKLKCANAIEELEIELARK